MQLWKLKKKEQNQKIIPFNVPTICNFYYDFSIPYSRIFGYEHIKEKHVIVKPMCSLRLESKMKIIWKTGLLKNYLLFWKKKHLLQVTLKINIENQVRRSVFYNTNVLGF